MVNLTINGIPVQVENNTTILQAAEKLGISIPTFCYDKRLIGHGSCRICVVEVKGARALQAACTVPAAEGMVVETHSSDVIAARREVLKLMIENHPLDCLTCEKAGKCKLQDYCYEYDVKEGGYNGSKMNYPIDDSNPFFILDRNKCIMCGKCIRVDNELQCTGAINYNDRGFDTHVGIPYDRDFEHSSCVFCGNCVSVCPVGALMPKHAEKFRTWELKRVKTTCSYCGVGCQMELLVKGNKVVGVEPVDVDPNNGLLCVKGKFGYKFIDHPDRLKTPYIRKDGKLVEATWDEAYHLIMEKMLETKEKCGPDALAGFSSARCTNEENYLFQKFFRAVIGTNNVDHCARLCHAPTVAGLASTLGSGAMTNSINEVMDADTIFIIGSNTTENHPVMGAKIKQARRKGAKIVVADPREIELAKEADVFLRIKPGTNIAIINGMMNVILEEGLQDKEFIAERTENFEELEKVVKNYTPDRVADICGVKAEDIRKAARLYAKADRASIVYSMGITQHTTGTDNVISTSNLALLCGNFGKESVGVNPLRGQNNVQGACDMGALPVSYPGYQPVTKPEAAEKFEKAWGAKLSQKNGLTITEILDGAEKGDIKLLYIMGENPMVSDPNINHVRHALERTGFLVVQDIFLTETAELADVVLPAASFAEKDGTFTNTERRVQKVRKAVEPGGNAKADWVIIMELMNRFGYAKTYKHPSEIMDEVAAVTPSYAGICYDRLETEGLQWPCPTKEHPGTKYLHKGTFSRGNGLFRGIEHKNAAELPDQEYPFMLTTGRILYHYHTGTMTRKVKGLNEKVPSAYVEISPSAAKRLGVNEGEMLKVASRRGSINVKAKISQRVEENVVFIPFHFAEAAANTLTNSAIDPISKIPEFKVCAVAISK